MAQATRTVNPLHFEDLEPHRFEDLVRQLIYDFRSWKTIEGIGRPGADDGIDIRAVEAATYAVTAMLEDDGDADAGYVLSPERTWFVQCKREKRLAAKEITKIVEDNLKNANPKPEVYVLVAACDFTKAARDAFRDAVISQGVEEYFIFGKAELEDMLFQPKNDYLLFAYFGISLQVRKRTAKTNLRSNYALKKKIKATFEDLYVDITPVLIRDENNRPYPYFEDFEQFAKAPLWRYWTYAGEQTPDCFCVKSEIRLAYVDWSKKEYDYINFDTGWPINVDLFGEPQQWDKPDGLSAQNYRDLIDVWEKVVPVENQARFSFLSCVPYERILLLDEIGDCCNEGPHLVVQRRANGSFFEDARHVTITSSNAYKPIEWLEADWKFTPYFKRLRKEFSDFLKVHPKLLASTAIDPDKA